MSSGRRDDPQGGPGEPVGSVSEEAAKLLGAVSGWAQDHRPDHDGSGAPECAWCPVCRTAHLVRTASPEVRDHLATAAASLMQAAAGFLAAANAPQERAQSSVEHIDLDADPDAGWPEEDA